MRGLVNGGTLAQAMFTLPVGYRPPRNLFFAVDANGAYGRVAVGLDGTVTHGIGAVTNVNLGAIEFDTDTVTSYPSGFIGPSKVGVLPANPVDGQEIYFVADATNGVIWHLRYNAGSASPYKWEYLGGPPMLASSNVAASSLGGGSSWSTQLTDGTGVIQMTVPLLGEYDVAWGGYGNVGDGSVRNLGLGVLRGGDAAPPFFTLFASVTGGGIGNGAGDGRYPCDTTARRQLLLGYQYVPVVFTMNLRRFTAVPVRVGP